MEPEEAKEWLARVNAPVSDAPKIVLFCQGCGWKGQVETTVQEVKANHVRDHRFRPRPCRLEDIVQVEEKDASH